MKLIVANKPVTVKVRKTWGEFSPVTRRVDSKKLYARKNRYNKRWE